MRDFPSGPNSIPVSVSGVVVILLVPPPSTLLTNTSPRYVNATSFPLGETTSPLAPLFTATMRSLFALLSAETAMSTLCGDPPDAGIV